jgi:prepilin-type N-terminal cleavage/methylation domain-containing protein/prepilin-type processing-associated H-X9-DG protein
MFRLRGEESRMVANKKKARSDKMKRKDQSGFTLIELLIVLVVIAVLTAILFPEFARTRETARRASCLSNVHQIALASEVYTQDYDETFLWNPPGGGTPGEVTSEQIRRRTGRQRPCADQPCRTWAELLQPYLKSGAVLRCPSFLPEDPSLEWLGLQSYRGSGYGLNAVLVGDECQPRTVASLRHSPSEVALIGDSAVPWSEIWLERDPAAPWPRGWADAVNLQELDEWPRALPSPAKVYWGWRLNLAEAPTWRPDLHSGGSNFAFADGHAQFLRPSAKVIDLTPAPVRGTAAAGGAADDKAGSFPGALLE